MYGRAFQLTVNGLDRQVSVPPMSRLLDVLRHDLGLTGTKEGCGEGECGSCSVLLNGELVNSCLVPVAQVNGASVVTIEGVGANARLHPVQQAFLECGGAQCGICTPGMILATLHLLERFPQPTYEQIREGLNGNLCRCTGYVRIFESVARAAATIRGDNILMEWNQLDAVEAVQQILPCCGSRAWAEQLVEARPFVNATALLQTSDNIWFGLPVKDWDQAFSSHPRIGEKRAPVSATTQSATWSAEEQGGVAHSSGAIQARLKYANESYEQRFGRTYIVCATGKTAEQMLEILERRLSNDAEQELLEAVEQQRQITRLRLRKWLQL
jgi:carbon-monoxide dehydrogenase small subunit